MGSQSARPKSSTLFSLQIPALLTRISTVPKRSQQAAIIWRGAPSAVISTCIKSTSTPCCSISSRVSPLSLMKLGINRLAPAFASAIANAWPRPLLPPVTIAVFPLREKKSIENALSDSIDIMWLHNPLGKKKERQLPPVRGKSPFSYSLVTGIICSIASQTRM
ncbi:hypothetical protein D3C86_1632890 [compost metagenome]